MKKAGTGKSREENVRGLWPAQPPSASSHPCCQGNEATVRASWERARTRATPFHLGVPGSHTHSFAPEVLRGEGVEPSPPPAHSSCQSAIWQKDLKFHDSCRQLSPIPPPAHACPIPLFSLPQPFPNCTEAVFLPSLLLLFLSSSSTLCPSIYPSLRPSFLPVFLFPSLSSLPVPTPDKPM